ncbi:hypothetical protein Vi05172_g13471 [Venturia inaequalis]|nr:hypothetical protein Vi05172_g13471 [Venturia inaequalis]
MCANTQVYINISFPATRQFGIAALAMATNTTPTVKILVGNSYGFMVMRTPVCINLLSAFSKAARRLLGAGAGTQQQQEQLQIKFPCSDYWTPDLCGMHSVLTWLTKTQIKNGILQFSPLTKELIKANQISLSGIQFNQLLRLYETLLFLEADNILAYQHVAVRGRIITILSNAILQPNEFAMLVHIFRAPQSQDIALVNIAISKAWNQLTSGQMPFVTGCAAYRTIVQSQLLSLCLPDFRKWISAHINTKLTLSDFLASLDFLCRADQVLANHAVKVLVLKEVRGGAESVELDRQAAVNPKLVAAIRLIRLERERFVQHLVTHPPQPSDPPTTPPTNPPPSQQPSLTAAPRQLRPFPVLTPPPNRHPTASPTTKRLQNPSRSKTYQPSTLGPNANRRNTRQANDITSNPTSFAYAYSHGNERIVHGLSAWTPRLSVQPTTTTTGAQSSHAGQLGVDTQSSFGILIGLEEEPEAELKERTRVAAARALMRFEDGGWVQGLSGLWGGQM